MNKPPAVIEVEDDHANAMNKAWDKLAETTPTITEEDLPLIIDAGRANRAKWLKKQAKKKQLSENEVEV